jgi:hypothetical protein
MRVRSLARRIGKPVALSPGTGGGRYCRRRPWRRTARSWCGTGRSPCRKAGPGRRVQSCQPPSPSQDLGAWSYLTTCRQVGAAWSSCKETSPTFQPTELLRLAPDVRIFLDRKSIDVGSAWQPAIFESLDQCRKVVALFSPAYLRSKVWQGGVQHRVGL